MTLCLIFKWIQILGIRYSDLCCNNLWRHTSSFATAGYLFNGLNELLGGPLACLSLPSVMSWTRSDSPIWKLALPQSCSPRIKRSRQSYMFIWWLLMNEIDVQYDITYRKHYFESIHSIVRKREIWARIKSMKTTCSHSEHVIEANSHCYYSMKYWRNWWHLLGAGLFDETSISFDSSYEYSYELS